MTGPVFVSKHGPFLRKNAALQDMVLGHMALDIEVMAKAKVPVRKGHLQSSISHHRNDTGKFRVVANKEYAAYQERGARRDGTHRVRRYTTAGTGKGWFKAAIETALRNRSGYITEARKALGL